MIYENEVVQGLRDDAYDYGADADGLLDLAEALEFASLQTMRESADGAKAADFERQAAEARQIAAIKADLRDHAWDTADTMVISEAAAELINQTPGAAYIDDVARIRGRRWTDLLAEETGIPWYRVGAIVAEQNARHYGPTWESMR